MVIKLEQYILKCGWCASAHVADVRCMCVEDCGAGWCAAVEAVGGAHP